MKKRILSLLIVLAVLAAAFPPSRSDAAQMLCFTGVDDTLMPLRDDTMPAYFGTKLYVPAGVFAEIGISSGVSSSLNNLYVYRESDKLRLNFFISLGLVMDQTGEIYEGAGLEIIGDVYFVPLDFMCEFFGLSYAVLNGDPLSVLRITSGNEVFNRKTYMSYYKNHMEQAYAEYSKPTETTVPPVPTPSGGDPSEPEESSLPVSYSGVDVYISFHGIDGEHTASILSTLSEFGVSACFFLTTDEILLNAGLVRRIAGEGHTIGLLLDSAELQAYDRASSLLFEAAKIVTPLVAFSGEDGDAFAEFCRDNSLIYCPATRVFAEVVTAADVTARLPVTDYGSVDFRFACSSGTARIISSVLRYLNEYEYNIRTINETYQS